MPTTLSIAIGAGLILVGMWDQFWTILGEGGGPVTRRVAGGLWRVSRWGFRRWPHGHLLSFGGVAAVLGTVASWVLLQWAGWTLVFYAIPGGVVVPGQDGPASIAEQAYFAGYTLSTLGIGDVQPRGAVARVLTAGASFTGLFQISFAVGYLVPIIVAATDKRRVSIYVSCLGESSTDVLLNMWDGRTVDPLGEVLRALTPELALLEQRHRAYPVLPYLHSITRAGAIGPSLAVLDEVLTTVTLGLDADLLPPGVVHAHRRALSTLVETLSGTSGSGETAVPPPPPLGPLREAGLPAVDDATFAQRVAELHERRRALHQIVQFDGWEWDDVATSDSDTDDEQLTSLYDTADV